MFPLSHDKKVSGLPLHGTTIEATGCEFLAILFIKTL